MKEQVLQFTEQEVAERPPHLWQFSWRILTERLWHFFQTFNSYLLQNKREFQPLTWDELNYSFSKENVPIVSLLSCCSSRGLWQEPAVFQAVLHLPHDTSYLLGPCKQMQQLWPAQKWYNQTLIFFLQKSGHWANQGFQRLFRRGIICPQNWSIPSYKRLPAVHL